MSHSLCGSKEYCRTWKNIFKVARQVQIKKLSECSEQQEVSKCEGSPLELAARCTVHGAACCCVHCVHPNLVKCCKIIVVITQPPAATTCLTAAAT